MNVAITGATGSLGRNLLFEFLKNYQNPLRKIHFFIFGRDLKSSLKERVQQILLDDGRYYLSVSEKDISLIDDYINHNITFVNFDLSKKNLSISEQNLKLLRNTSIDFFYHIAGNVDIRDGLEIKKNIDLINVQGTKNLLNLIASLSVKEFCFVGTAYSCGCTSGLIQPDYINRKQKFRNPYELSKLMAEIEVKMFREKTGIKCRFFRPSIICGRLIENQLGQISKFDVFYQWIAFFVRTKIVKFKNLKEALHQPLALNIRLRSPENTSLNIVPVDYVAKMIYLICTTNYEGESYHLVNPTEIQCKFFLDETMNYLNIAGARGVNEIPKDLNKLERQYYKWVDSIFSEYFISESMVFDTSNLDNLLQKVKLECPPIDAPNFKLLLDYATENKFGNVKYL